MALFNGGFPATYQPVYQPVQYQPMQYQQPQQMQQQPVQQPTPPPMNSNMIWVSGEAGAKAYLVAPNTTVQLWDSEAQRIYLKSADSSGMPTIKTLDYTIRDSAPQTPVNAAINPATAQPTEYAGKAEQDAMRAEMAAYKSEIEALRADLETFRGDLYGIAGKKPAMRKKEATEDE